MHWGCFAADESRYLRLEATVLRGGGGSESLTLNPRKGIEELRQEAESLLIYQSVYVLTLTCGLEPWTKRRRLI